MASSNYRHTDVKAHATVDGARVEIVSLSVRYAINSLPTATVILAVGRNAEAASLSAAVDVYSKQMYRSPLNIYANFGNRGDFLLFRGYVSGVSVKKSSSMFGVAIGGISWFNDLNAGTPFSSGLTAAATLYDLKVPIAAGPGTMANGAPPYSLEVLQQVVTNQLANNSVGSAIMKTALELTGTGDIGGNQALKQAVSNDYAAAALKATTIDLVSALPGGAAVTKDGFGNAIGSAFWTTFSGSTLWSALVSMTVSMGYVIIPLINKLYIMPWTPILSTPSTHFSATTIAATDNNFGLAPNIKTMFIYNQDEMTTMTLLAGTTKVPGLFTNESMESGMTDMAPAPRWLRDTIGTESSIKTMTVAAGIRARAPNTGGTTDVDFSLDEELKSKLTDLTRAASRYAKFMYALKALGSRSVITGPPQGNIIPGMNLSFSLGDDVGEMDGFVNAVVYNIDSEHHATDMSVELTQVRSTPDSGALGMDAGVMWRSVVGGGSIIRDEVTASGGTEEDA